MGTGENRWALGERRELKVVRWKEVGENIGENGECKKYEEKQGWLALEHVEQLVLGSNKRGGKVGFVNF